MLTSVSLRSLINVRIALAVVIVLFVGIATALWQARESVAREVEASFNLAVEMIESGKQQSKSQSQWQHILTALQHARHIQVTVIDSQGIETNLVVNDNKQDRYTPALYRYLVASPTLTAEYQVYFYGVPQTIRVKSDPNDEISEAWDESLAYFVSILAMMVLIYVMINLVFHSAFNAVGHIKSRINDLEAGDYTTPLPRFNISEFDTIGEGLNHLSSVLDEAKKSNQALSRHTLQIQENERQNLSRELHDEMGQSLTAIKAMSVALKEPSSDKDYISDAVVRICDHLSGVVRSMMRSLHPLSLSELGLSATLSDMMYEWQRRHPKMDIHLEYDDDIEGISDDIAIQVYRIIQESLTNVVKHANATTVIVEVKKTVTSNGEYVDLSVTDNGVGGSLEGDGFGVRSMRERVNSLNGHFEFNSTPGRGVVVLATLPLISDAIK
jgi:two-component system sensor histidine kinase UhpB